MTNDEFEGIFRLFALSDNAECYCYTALCLNLSGRSKFSARAMNSGFELCVSFNATSAMSVTAGIRFRRRREQAREREQAAEAGFHPAASTPPLTPTEERNEKCGIV